MKPLYNSRGVRVPGMFDLDQMKKGGMAGCSIKNGCKSKAGGLTAKGRKMINSKTGSNLKAPQPGGGPRKRSFCARNLGQIKKFNIDCRATPEKRACKARKRWKC